MWYSLDKMLYHFFDINDLIVTDDIQAKHMLGKKCDYNNICQYDG